MIPAHLDQVGEMGLRGGQPGFGWHLGSRHTVLAGQLAQVSGERVGSVWELVSNQDRDLVTWRGFCRP